MPTFSNTDAIIDAAMQLANTLSSALTNNKNKMRTFHNKHSKHIQCLSAILSEIVNNHKNNIGMQSILVKPYSIDNKPSYAKPNTKTTTNNISALPRVSPSVSALPRTTKHVPVPRVMPPDDVSCENSPFLSPLTPNNDCSSNLILPDDHMPSHRYSTRKKSTSVYQINLLVETTNNISMLQNYFINLVTNPFAG